MNTAPFGTWTSPISTNAIVAGGISLAQLRFDGNGIYWLERRPDEGGRVVLVRHRDGQTEEQTPPPFSVRSRANEYGGGAYAVRDGVIWFSNDPDQCVYRITPESAEPVQITPPSDQRFADFCISPGGTSTIAVCEDHSPECLNGHEPTNTLVLINKDGTISTLASGADFYSSPTVNPAATELAWLQWDHPNMPWDGTDLYRADWSGEALHDTKQVAGGKQESIFQPQWSQSGELRYISDQTGWWNLFQSGETLLPMAAEFGRPQWVFGMSTWGQMADGRIASCYTQDGLWHVGRFDPAEGLASFHRYKLPYQDIQEFQVQGHHALLHAAAADRAPAVVLLDLETGEYQVLRESGLSDLDTRYLSRPEPMLFHSGDHQAHALYYPPCNPDYQAPEGELPPLLVKIHGGPTAATSVGLNLQIQYWTSRGFGLVDVNYGGSTGYGRPYRELLHLKAGIVDVQDCVNAAKHLIETGRVDGERCAIRGSSAGGYTALAALTFHDLFKAGASYYGISDLATLAQDTHKFEARYVDRLVAPWPEGKAVYEARSPLHHIDQLSVPVIFFQGEDDKVVPPNQAEMMVDALKEKGLPVAYHTFPGEGHGFRRAATIKATLREELAFYGEIFKFQAADNLSRLRLGAAPENT